MNPAVECCAIIDIGAPRLMRGRSADDEQT
jgi:hypothetical protein